MSRVLFRIKPGIKNALQASCVVRAIQQYHTDWTIGIEARPGTIACFDDIANIHPISSTVDYRQHYQKQLTVRLDGVPDTNELLPRTAVLGELQTYWQDVPVEAEDFVYKIKVTAEAQEAVDKYTKDIGDYIVIEHDADTAWEALAVSTALKAHGVETVLLNWSDTWIAEYCKHPSVGHWLWRTDQDPSGRFIDAGILKALIVKALLCFSFVDGSAAHVAHTTSTATYCYWWDRHPVYDFPIAKNVTHFVPQYADDYAKLMDLDWFQSNYNFKMYGDDLTEEIDSFLREMLASAA